MKTMRKNKRKNPETGVALLVAMISLLLITAVGVAMIVASGSESAVSGNYRSSSSAYYAAIAGLEEGRGRLLPTNPNTLVAVANSGIPAFGTPMLVNQVAYILNPNIPAGESAATILGTYPDNEYDQEFGQGQLGAAVKFFNNSLSGTNAANIPGPLYKWVRINPVTEASLNIDIDNDNNKSTTVLYYETANNPPSLSVVSSPSAYQVLEITALAVLPNGTEKLSQYLVTPKVFGMNFNSALTLAGNVATFLGATSNQYRMNGLDGSGNPPAVPGCVNNAPTVDAIGVTNPSDISVVQGGIPANRTKYYTGLPPTVGTSDVNVVTPSPTLSTPASLDQMVTNVRNNADIVIPNPPNPQNYNNSGTTYNFGQNGPGYTWPTDMSATNPKTIYVDGSFDLGPNTGYGLLVVTGNFRYQGNSGWKGIILVVGDGTTTFLGNGGGSGEFDGTVFVANTRNLSGVQLGSFGAVNFDITGGGGNGIYFNSCWIKQAQRPPTYKVLSFREIAYTD